MPKLVLNERKTPVNLSTKLLVGFLTSLLAFSACAADFNPIIDTSGANTDTIGMTDGGSTGDEGSTGEGTGGSTGDGTTGMDVGGSDVTGGSTGGSTGGTGEPEGGPYFGEPCDPFVVDTGLCQPYPDDHPDYQQGWTYTCAPWETMPDPNTWNDSFICQRYSGFKLGDQKVDPEWHQGYPGDMCPDDGGDFQYGGCQNGPCVRNTNLLPEDCVSPQYLYNDSIYKEQPMEYPFCCSTYCDADHPCKPGYTCDGSWDLDKDEQTNETGFCAYYG